VEGGYFRELYRSSTIFNTELGQRSAYTHIYYLLKKDQISALHRLKSDEIWHFYSGDPVTVVEISPEGVLNEAVLGASIAEQKSEYLFLKGHWFGAYLNPGSDWALLGCTVSPGFEYRDFEIGSREKLTNQYPKLRDYILRLTQPRPL
jgi:predicted cupin superfamily sugar epimerase